MSQEPPKIFIGASKEAHKYTKAICSELEADFLPTAWNHAFAGATLRSTLDLLMGFTTTFDYAVMVLAPNDILISRGKKHSVARDNVIFELGLYIGAFGTDRVFLITPHDVQIHLPTDLDGARHLFYMTRSDNNYEAAVQTACSRITKAINESTRKPTAHDGSALDVKFWHTVADRETSKKDVGALIKASNDCAIITGITLSFIIRSCQQDLLDALDRNVLVGIVISANAEPLLECYSGYSRGIRKRLPDTRKEYLEFIRTLTPRQKRHFFLCYCRVPMMHSIGYYDGRTYVNGFCLNRTSTTLPTFSPRPGSPSHDAFVSEIHEFLKKSSCANGKPIETLIAALAVD